MDNQKMAPPPPSSSMLILLLLTAMSSLANGADQMMCGSNFSGATLCGAHCPGGTDGECPDGQSCYAGVDCPLPPTISPAPTRAPPPSFALGNHDKQIIGYYASWQWYDRAKLTKPANMDFNKVTRVNYAFFQLDPEGNIWGTDEWADPRVLFGDVTPGGECIAGEPMCRCSWIEPQYKSCSRHDDSSGLIWLAHQARAEIYPSIGGWTLSDAFPPMSADATSRKIFARNCKNLIKDYNFDGIDLDWEYPGYTDHSGTPADTANFNLLLQDIRAELDALGRETGRFYGLTAALPCGPSNIKNIDIGTVAQYLTEFNLMSYDFHGAWDTMTGVNSPLYDQADDPEAGWSVDGCVKNWVAAGAPQERLNIGLAFYGRSFMDAKELGVPHGGTDEFSWEIDEGTPQYFNVMDKINGMEVNWDEETGTPYALFNDGKGGLVSFDDERAICLKTEYAIQKDLNGFIIWELSGDIMDDLSTPLLNIINRKLSENDTNCADPFGPKLSMTSTEATVTAAATTQAATTQAATTASSIDEDPTSMDEEPDTSQMAESISSADEFAQASSPAVNMAQVTFEEPTTNVIPKPDNSQTAQSISSAIESEQEEADAIIMLESVSTTPEPMTNVIPKPDNSQTAQAISSAIESAQEEADAIIMLESVSTTPEPTTNVIPKPNNSQTAQAISSAIELAQEEASSPAMEIKPVKSDASILVSSPMLESISTNPMELFTQSFEQFNDGRKKVVRTPKKPEKPYRPPKEL